MNLRSSLTNLKHDIQHHFHLPADFSLRLKTNQPLDTVDQLKAYKGPVLVDVATAADDDEYEEEPFEEENLVEAVKPEDIQ